jgi:hypothetical protein
LEEHNKVSEDEPKTLLDLLGLFSMYEFIKTMRRVFDATAVRVILMLLVGIPGLGFLVWTLLIEGTGFTAFFSTATADERSVLRLAAITYWVLVMGWLGVFLRLLCSSSYLDTLPLLRFFVLFLLGVFTIAWTLLLITSMNAGSFVNLIPVVLTLLLLLGTLPPGRHLS